VVASIRSLEELTQCRSLISTTGQGAHYPGKRQRRKDHGKADRLFLRWVLRVHQRPSAPDHYIIYQRPHQRSQRKSRSGCRTGDTNRPAVKRPVTHTSAIGGRKDKMSPIMNFMDQEHQGEKTEEIDRGQFYLHKICAGIGLRQKLAQFPQTANFCPLDNEPPVR